MKSHAKSKRRASHGHHAAASAHRSHKPAPARRHHVAAKSSTDIAQEGTDVSRADEAPAEETFTPMETGSPDRDEGLGPLGQEGEGEAQNDSLAALEEIEPDEGADI
ncbi:MAG: hypothetical protein ACHQ49_14275 [Elusimicrobiota bacterium]